MVLSTPNYAYLVDRIAYAFGRDVKEEGYHFRFFTKSKLQGMLTGARLEMVDSASFGGLLGINFIFKLLTLGKFRIKPIQIPRIFESLFARTFVYRVQATLIRHKALERLPEGNVSSGSGVALVRKR